MGIRSVTDGSLASIGRLVPRDRITMVFVLLVVGVQLAAIATAMSIPALSGPTADNPSTDVEIGIAFTGLLVLESVLVTVVWLTWNRFSIRLRGACLRVAAGVVGLGCGDLLVVSVAVLTRKGELLQTAVETGVLGTVLVLGYVGYRRIHAYGMFWVLFNLAGLAIGIALVALCGRAVAPVVILPFMLLSMAWDVIAVRLSGVMTGIVAASSAATVPNHVIIPARLRVDWEAVTAWLADTETNEKPASVEGVIGVGDLAVPAIFTVSVWVTGSAHLAVWAMLGTVVAVVALRDAAGRSAADLPGLPWLNTGAVAGFMAGVVVSGTPLLTALGL